MSTDQTNDSIKIKEDAVKLKEKDIEDTIKSLDNQAIVSYYIVSAILWFLALVFREVSVDKSTKITVLVLGFILVFIWFYNILSKKVDIHSDMSWVFSEKYKKTYDEYLDKKYQHLSKIYTNVKNWLLEKSNLNRCISILWAVYILISLYNLIK